MAMNFLTDSSNYKDALRIAKNCIDHAEERMAETVNNLTKDFSGKPMRVKSIRPFYNFNIENYRKSHGSYFSSTKDSDTVTARKAKDAVEEYWKEAQEIHEGNKEAIANNQAGRDAIERFMLEIGISKNYSTWGYKTSRSSKKTESKHTAGWVEDMQRCFVINDSFSVAENFYKEKTLEIDNWLKSKEYEAAQAAAEKEKEAEVSKLQGEAIAYLLEHGKKINEDFTTDCAIKVADDLAADLFIKEQEGEAQNLHGCDECSTWIAGEHRCSCGNRRVCWSTESDHSFKQPSLYPEAY